MRRTWISFASQSLIAGSIALSSALFTTACRDDADTTSSSSSGASTSSSTGSGAGGGGTALKILNWNLHNFYDDKDNGSMTGEIVKSSADYKAQTALIAKVIGALDPDVAILQEVENQGALDTLNTALGNKYPERSLIEGNDTRGINNAALSKIPFAKVVSHKDDQFVEAGSGQTFSFTRDAIEYHFSFAGRSVALVGVHFRSKVDPDNPNKRLAEAERARAIADEITKADAETGVVILGDYNDTPNSDPMTAIKGKAPNLYADSATFVPTADQWSFDFMGTKELIDHQMANPVMSEFVEKDTATIVHSKDVDDASDHSPMMITYLVK
ncbi:MAG: endonuclease/exonuclease/phosphatase family protein [Polyangiaceae bacterium]